MSGHMGCAGGSGESSTADKGSAVETLQFPILVALLHPCFLQSWPF